MILDNFLSVGHESQAKCLNTLLPILPNTTLRELFIKYITFIPSTAAVERLFSLEKDVLKSKRAGLSVQHFEMLVVLK